MQTLQEQFISEEDIRNSINTVFIFGDNLQGVGLGGQAAVARQFVKVGKAIGIPTKRRPSNDADAFFADRDDEIFAVRRSFTMIRQLKRDGKRIVFFPHIGEGMADLPSHSPAIYGMILGFVESFK